MDVKQVRELYEAAPFQPFDIILPGGSKVIIDHPFCPIEGGAWQIDAKLVTEGRTPSSNFPKQRKRKR